MKNNNTISTNYIYLSKIYIWIISYLKKYWLYVTGFVFCSIIISASELAIPKIIEYFIDYVLPDENIELLWKLILALIFVVFFMTGATIYKNVMQRIISEKPIRDIQLSMFEKIRSLGFSYYEKNTIGDTLSLFNSELKLIGDIYKVYLPILIHVLIMTIIASILIMKINVQLSLVAIPAFFIYYIFGPKLDKKSVEVAQSVRKKQSLLDQKVYDSIVGLLEIKAQSKELWDLNRIREKLTLYKKSKIEEWFYVQLRGMLRKFTIQIGMFFVYIYGIILVKNGVITTGEFVSFTLIFYFVVGNLTVVLTFIIEQKNMIVQAERAYKVFNLNPDIEEDPNPVDINNIRGEYNLNNVYFKYHTTSNILQSINLHIRAGERVAFVGASGSGKTTLLKLLGRFYDPVKGQITLDGVPLSQISLSKLRDSIGIVFQETYLFGDSVAENIRFGNPAASDQQIMSAAKASHAHDFIMQLKDGYETIVGERGIKLSGGQKQRLTIARMLIKDPKIVLLDEATSALDNITELEVQKALNKLLEGRTTITIAHRLSTIKEYDRIVVFEKGMILEEGQYNELISRKGYFYKLLKGGDDCLAKH